MKSAKDLKNTNIKSWRMLANAFYSVAHNDFNAWIALPIELKQTDVGIICEEYLRTKNEELIENAGCLLAGENWYVALGR